MFDLIKLIYILMRAIDFTIDILNSYKIYIDREFFFCCALFAQDNIQVSHKFILFRSLIK